MSVVRRSSGAVGRNTVSAGAGSGTNESWHRGWNLHEAVQMELILSLVATILLLAGLLVVVTQYDSRGDSREPTDSLDTEQSEDSHRTRKPER